MQAVSVREVLDITKGKLICGNVDAEITEFSIDSRTLIPGSVFIAIKGNRFDGHEFVSGAIKKGAVGIIVEESYPDVSPHQFSRLCHISKRYKLSFENWCGDVSRPVFVIKVVDTIKAIGDIARIFRKRFSGSLIAVTGTVGKTTTKEFIATVLEEKFCVHKTQGTLNNHIGVPLTLWGLEHRYEACVMELGMNNLGEIGYLADICQPDVGVITNIGPSHLEQLGSVENIVKAKSELLTSLKPDGLVILNRDNDYFPQLRTMARCRVVTIGRHQEADFQAVGFKIIAKPFSDILEIKLPVIGSHSVYPALTAVAIGYGFGMNPQDIINGLGRVSLPKMRLELKEIAGMKIIDDSYNANPVSMMSALETLARFRAGGKKIFVCSDMLELGEKAEMYHSELGRHVVGYKIDRLITIGELSSLVSDTAIESGMLSEFVQHCEDNISAVEAAAKWLEPGDIVLVKGSRARHMEEIVKGIEEYYSTLEKLIV